MISKCVIPVILINWCRLLAESQFGDYTWDTKTDISRLAFFGKDVKWNHTLFIKIKIKVLVIFLGNSKIMPNTHVFLCVHHGTLCKCQ